METYLGGVELRFESRVITVCQSSSNLEIRELKWHGCICFYISLGTDPRYLNSKPPLYVSVAT